MINQVCVLLYCNYGGIKASDDREIQKSKCNQKLILGTGWLWCDVTTNQSPASAVSQALLTRAHDPPLQVTQKNSPTLGERLKQAE